MYEASIRLRARDGIRTHGSLDAYLRDYRACAKLFEMYVAGRLTRERGTAFLLWEDVDHATKEARGLTRADTGIDVTDGATTIVQCKLRSRAVTWGECATFFGSAVAYESGSYSVPWSALLLARNASSRLSPHLRALAGSRPFDTPIEMGEVDAFCTGLLSTPEPPTPRAPAAPIVVRDYQREAIELCCAETDRAAYVVLPTGTGKNVVIAESVRRILAEEGTRVLVLVPLIVLCEQLQDILGDSAVVVGGGNTPSAADISRARLVLCVYNSAASVDAAAFTRVFIDEAHFARPPALYTDLRDGSDTPEAGYAVVREAATLPFARLLSATLDVPEGAPAVTRGVRAMIDAGYLRDYTIDVLVFSRCATDADVARHLARNCRSILVFCATRDEGRAFCAEMNALGPCAKYIDCDTPRAERRETLDAFRSGDLAFIVNVRVLSVGFDAPITKGVCFLRIPSSQTQAVQMIGRCLRPHHDKRIARVILPLVAGESDAESESDDGAAKRVLALMRVMAQTDPRFARAMRSGGGAYVSVTSATADGADEHEAAAECELLHEVIYNSMGQALRGAWHARLDELVAYHAANGRMPLQSTPEGRWACQQRFTYYVLPAERKAMLDALPWWQWNALDAAWRARYDEIVAYHAEHGHMPALSTPAGTWVHSQRQAHDAMPAERKAMLDALPWWQWKPRDAAWRAQYDEVVAFHAEHGRLPRQSDGASGAWVNQQRWKRATMPAYRKALLEALPFWTWSAA